MANRTRVPCHAKPCPALVDPKARFCPEHIHLRKQYALDSKQNWKPNKDYLDRSKAYKTKRWVNLRRYFLLRNPVCIECKAIATQADHILPVSLGGDMWALDNLQPLCRSCHSSKTRREMNRKKRVNKQN